MDINQSYMIPIDKLMFWKAGSWVKYDNKFSNISLRLHFDQVLITNNNKILESLNLNSKIKGIYRGDVLILIICTAAQEVRKLKFQIKRNVALHLQRLGEHFPVVSHKSTADNNLIQFRKIEDVFKNVLEDYKDNGETSSLPPNFNEFVKICLLDPAFPQVVHEAQKIIEIHSIKQN